jgi:thiamine biosynthesis protein ThiS
MVIVRHAASEKVAHSLDATDGLTVREVLQSIGLSLQACIVAVNGVVVPVDEEVHDGDELCLVRAMSGG